MMICHCPKKKRIQFGQDILDALQGQKVEDQKKTQEAGNQLPGSDQISQFYAILNFSNIFCSKAIGNNRLQPQQIDPST